MKTSICELVRESEQNYLNGSVKTSEYVEWDMHDTIERIDAYLNSKHISGDTDSLGREKPFFNIVTAAANIWFRATDLDRKNIRILPDASENVMLAFVATQALQQWMREQNFGVFLNEWGRTLARYGSAVVKFVEKDGKLVPSVIPWNRLIVDPIDFEAIPVIEKLYLTPAQLRQNTNYDKDVVDELLESLEGRKTLDGQSQDNSNNFIEVYEVHGEMPAYFLKGEDYEPEEDEEQVYANQMHVISFTKSDNGDYNDFTLYKGREKKNPYMITHLIPEDGRTLAIGAVEHLFNAQWMVNHSMKNIKDTLDLASKLIFQTSDSTYVGRNALSTIETGDILIHQVNQPLTQINNSKADISSYENFAAMWRNLGSEITSTPDALRGNTLPSGTPYSLGAYLGEQANSLFELMTENKGLHIEEMLRGYIIPHLKSKMDTTDEIVAIMDAEHIQKIDSIFIKNEAIRYSNEKLKSMVLAGEIPNPADQERFLQEAGTQIQDQLNNILGDQRFFRPSDVPSVTWKQLFKDFEWKVIVEVTNEQSDKQAIMQTLATLYTTTAQTDPVKANIILSRILTETGVFSPMQLQSTAKPSAPAPSPIGQPMQGGMEALSNNQTVNV